MNKKILISIMNDLAKDRPVFYSEADFQHALAWKIREKYGNVTIRLEKGVGDDQYIDIVIGNGEIYIELKYKTCKLTKDDTGVVVQGECFGLKNQGAQDNSKYDFWKDVERVQASENGGYAIFLTNDHLYWGSDNEGYSAEEFAINEGREMCNVKKMAWNLKNGKTKKGKRNKCIEINLKDPLKWETYKNLEGGYDNEVFKYLLVDSPPK